MTAEPYTEAWHDERLQGLGSSDIPAVLGISKWKSPYHLYLEKVGEYVPERKDTPYTRWGKILEPLIIDEWAQETGLAYARSGRRVWHLIHDWAHCEVDAWAQDPGDGKTLGVVEAKTSSAWNVSEWADDEVPVAYVAQHIWQLFVTGYPQGWVAVLIGGNDFRVYPIEYDATVAEMIFEKAAEFWQRVQDRNPPDPDGAQSTTDVLNALYASVDAGSVASVGQEAVDLGKRYWEAHREAKRWGDIKAECANRLRALSGGAEILDCDGQKVATWKEQGQTRFDEKAFAERFPLTYAKFKIEKRFRVLRPSAALKEK